jgi:hypothetical protein
MALPPPCAGGRRPSRAIPPATRQQRRDRRCVAVARDEPTSSTATAGGGPRRAAAAWPPPARHRRRQPRNSQDGRGHRPSLRRCRQRGAAPCGNSVGFRRRVEIARSHAWTLDATNLPRCRRESLGPLRRRVPRLNRAIRSPLRVSGRGREAAGQLRIRVCHPKRGRLAVRRRAGERGRGDGRKEIAGGMEGTRGISTSGSGL